MSGGVPGAVPATGRVGTVCRAVEGGDGSIPTSALSLARPQRFLSIERSRNLRRPAAPSASIPSDAQVEGSGTWPALMVLSATDSEAKPDLWMFFPLTAAVAVSLRIAVRDL